MVELAFIDEYGFIGKDAKVLADVLRLNALSAIMMAGSGHVGTCFSSAEIVAVCAIDGHRLLSSKGHDAPLLYAAQAYLGRIPPQSLRSLRKAGGLPGHPEAGKYGMEASTGSLGVGLAKAMGLAWAEPGVFRVVLLGDGEMQEGMVWEALRNHPRNLCLVVDQNGYGSDERIRDDALMEKLDAFGWYPVECDGHDVEDLRRVILSGRAVVARTVKGKGVSFMEKSEGLYPYHSGAPSPEEYERARDEILSRLLGATVTRETFDPPERTTNDSIDAYARALATQGRDERIVVLDADLVKDCGLLGFRDRYPERFIECGISEQYMVSLAGGLALAGKIPIVHTFAAFMARAIEQMYMNALDGTHVVYVGSLTRRHSAGPSHDARLDWAFRKIPGLRVLEATRLELVGALLGAAINMDGPVYLRLP